MTSEVGLYSATLAEKAQSGETNNKWSQRVRIVSEDALKA